MAGHVMLDLETLGKGDRAAIISIGAVKFDPAGVGVESGFYVNVDAESAQAYGLQIDASTVMWWLHADREVARRALLESTPVGLAEALDGFADWFGTDSLPTWGNGATFDNIITRNAFAAVGRDLPWKFWDDRCYRTLKNLAPALKLERVGTYHNALDDATSQALHMQAIVAHLGLVL